MVSENQFAAVAIAGTMVASVALQVFGVDVDFVIGDAIRVQCWRAIWYVIDNHRALVPFSIV